MIPARNDISDIYMGDTWDRAYRVRRAGVPRDLTGYTGVAQIKQTRQSGTTIARFRVTVLDQTNPATLGAFVLGLSSAETAALPVPGEGDAGRGVFDVEFTRAGDTFTPVAGDVIWTLDVTRAS